MVSLQGDAEIILLKTGEDVVRLRQLLRTQVVAIKLSLVDQTKYVTAASELARNVLDYGGGGEARVQRLSDGMKQGIRIEFIDQGPGIADLELALKDGYTSGGGMGLGLGGARRLSDEFAIDTRPGEGTHITITKWKSF
jgi:serine/threonine-protein kinase RsbT